MNQTLDNLSASDLFFVKRVTEIIDGNLHNAALSSGFLGEFFCMSQRNFSRRVKQVMGQNVTLLIRDRRMAKACELLEKTSLPISEIYIKCGFDSANYFARVFRIYFGIPPTRYRMKKKNQLK